MCATLGTMFLHTEAEVVIAAPRDEVFDRLTTDDALSRYCKKRGPFAAIERAKTQGPVETGAERTITMGDGMVLQERILELTRPERHEYEWRDPPLPLGALIRSARGCWRFRDAGERTTAVSWHYTFELTSRFLRPAGKLLVGGFRGWMQAALDRARDDF